MGVGLYIYATNFSKYGIIANAFVGPIPLILLLIWKMSIACYNKYTIGTFIDRKSSNIVDGEGEFRYENIIPLVGNWLANIAHIFLFTYAFKFARLGGLNQGVIVTMIGFAMVFNSCSFYFAFGETLSKMKIFGVILSFGCVIFLGLAASTKPSKPVAVNADGEGGMSQSSYSFIALGLAFGVPVGFSIKHYVTRKYKGSYQPMFVAVDSGILESITCCVLAIIHEVQTGFSLKQMFLGGLAGTLMMTGRITMAVSVASGQGGPAQAIMSLNAIVVVLLSLIIDKQALSLFQVLAVVMGTLGAIVISVGDKLLEKCCGSENK